MTKNPVNIKMRKLFKHKPACNSLGKGCSFPYDGRELLITENFLIFERKILSQVFYSANYFHREISGTALFEYYYTLPEEYLPFGVFGLCKVCITKLLICFPSVNFENIQAFKNTWYSCFWFSRNAIM